MCMRLCILPLALLLSGCAHGVAERLIVRAPAPSERLAPGQVVPTSSPSLQASGPILRRGLGAWQIYEAHGAPTGVEREACRRRRCLLAARRKANLFTGTVVLGMGAYGAAVFGAGSSGWQTADDGWFGEFTGSGGADKLGHALSAHVQTAVYSAVFRHWGIPRREAALRGAAAAFAAQFALEAADGFSADHGFSRNDVIANAAGCLFGYFHETSPGFARIFDFRWEYWPSSRVRTGEDGEVTTDYEGSAYVLAANVGALVGHRRTPLDFVDLHLGYATRYYSDRSQRSERRPFVGLGLSLPTVCERLGLRRLATFFHYYQPPGIHLRWDTNLND